MSSVVALSQYRVELADLECTEYQFRVPVDFTITVKDNPATPDIIQLITAVSNFSGGVVSLCSQRPCDDITITSWMEQFKSKLRNYYTQDEFIHNIRLHFEQANNQTTMVHILMKKSVRTIIYDYGLYQRSDAENIKVTNNETASKLMKAKSGTFVDKTCSSYEWDSPVSDIFENSTTELKCWNTKNVSQITTRLKDERNENSLFAFLNNPEGGTILIGVKEDGNTNQTLIKGQKLSEHEDATLISDIEQILNEDRQGQKRIWGTTERAPGRGTYWDVKTEEVVNGPDKHRRVVIRIQLKHYPGGVFKYSPQAFKVNDDGTVSQFTVDGWRNVILHPSDKQTATSKSTFEIATQAAKAAVALLKTKTQSSRGTNQSNTASSDIDQIDSPSLHISLKQEQQLSFTDNTKDWREYLRIGHNKLSDLIHEAPNPLGVGDSLTFLPEKRVILSYGQNTENMQRCLAEIEKLHGSTRGVAIASKQWLKLIEDSSSSLRSPPHGHIIDVVTIDLDCKLNIWVICDQNPGDTSLIAYTREVGRTLKRILTTILPTRLVPSVSVHSRLFIAGRLSPSSDLDKVCADYFTPDRDQTNVLQQALVALLLSKKTSIQTTVGDQCLITLTLHQAAQTIGSEIAQLTRVLGGPGTGKTILLLYLSSHVFDREECVILCANKNLKAYFEFLDAAQSEVVSADEDMISFLETDLFQSHYCLLIDDCQLLSLKNETWFALFDKIITQHKALFVFSDNEIQDYGDHVKFADVVDQYERQTDGVIFREIRLTAIHRNCQKVASFLSKTAFMHSKSRLLCAHDEVGDDVQVMRVESLRDQGPDNGLVKLIASLIDHNKLMSGHTAAYEARHIAVLVDGKHSENDVELFKQILNKVGYQTQNADTFPRTAIIVTSVQSFSGLDAKVVLLIAPEKFSPRDQPHTELGLHDEKYKAFVASRGVYRVMFIIDDSLNPSIMRAMKMDKLSAVVPYCPDYARCALRHRANVPDVSEYHPSLAVCPVSGRVIVVQGTDKLYVLTGSLDLAHTVTVEGWGLRGVAVSRRGVVYVTDAGNHQVHVLEQADWSYTSLGREGSLPGEYRGPHSVSVSATGEVYVVDRSNKMIQVLSADGKYIRQFGSEGPGQFESDPWYISVSSTGTVAVNDDDGDIYLYTEAGDHFQTVAGGREGSFVYAHSLCFDSQGNLLVEDDGTRVVVLGPGMEPVTDIDTHKLGMEEVMGSMGVAPDGSLLLADKSDNVTHITVCDVPQKAASV